MPGDAGEGESCEDPKHDPSVAERRDREQRGDHYVAGEFVHQRPQWTVPCAGVGRSVEGVSDRPLPDQQSDVLDDVADRTVDRPATPDCASNRGRHERGEDEAHPETREDAEDSGAKVWHEVVANRAAGLLIEPLLARRNEEPADRKECRDRELPEFEIPQLRVATEPTHGPRMRHNYQRRKQQPQRVQTVCTRVEEIPQSHAQHDAVPTVTAPTEKQHRSSI